MWKKSTEQAGILVQIKSAKAFLLELDAHVEYPVTVRTDKLELEEHSSEFLSYVRGAQHILYEFTTSATYSSLFQLPSLASKNRLTYSEGALKRKANNYPIGKPFIRKSSMFVS